MRLRLPRLLRLVVLLLVLLLLLTSLLSYGVRAVQPVPICLLYTESADEGYLSKFVDPRSGQMRYVDSHYYSTLDLPRVVKDMSPTGRAFSMISKSPYAAPDWLYVGVPSSTKLNLVAYDWYISSGWSPDGSEFAYVFQDRSAVHIAITDAAGNHQRIQALNRITNGGITCFAGWSADGNYLAVMNYLDEYVAAYYFVDAETLQPVLTSVSTYSDDYQVNNGLVWSPQGHRFAYIDSPARQPNLIIATPEHGVEHSFGLLASDERFVELPLVWSPDGHFVTLHRATMDSKLWNNGQGQAWEYWTYGIFGIDGAMHIGIKGQKIDYANDRLPVGWWSADSNTWFFRQHLYVNGVNETDKDIASYIMAYHIDTDTYQVLIDHVAGSPLLSDDGKWFAVPVWSEDKFNLAFVSMDGMQKQIIDRRFDEITDMRWVDDQRSLTLVGRRGDAFTFEIVDFYTGASMIKIDVLPKQSFAEIQGIWPPVQRLTPSPSGQKLILKVGELEHQSLILVSVATKRLQPLLMEGYTIGNIYWAVDESAFAFIRQDSVKKVDTLQIVSVDGDTLNQVELLPRGSNILAGWTWCP